MTDTTLLELNVYTILWFLGIVLFWGVVAYLVIRWGVYHGMRSHTRWVDAGKDDY